ncbi:RNA polymerase sigma factor [Sorangium sp. So ce362]|uniref:RNA polymerase sigma factor n=1 Tax=Sorangium sp. So ce362 TaxID=3133303 RepID=UPI003F6254AC
MKRPRKGAHRPPAARHPRKRPPIEAILAERSVILAVLIASGVPARDREDVAQGILLNAWRSVRRGMYRPDPKVEPRAALRAWLYGVSWRKTGHYLGSAWVRRAVLHAQPLGRLREPIGPDLEAQVDEREVLRALAELPAWQAEALLSVDDPESLAAYAKRRGMSRGTAASRLRIARKALALKLRRWRR